MTQSFDPHKRSGHTVFSKYLERSYAVLAVFTNLQPSCLSRCELPKYRRFTELSFVVIVTSSVSVYKRRRSITVLRVSGGGLLWLDGEGVGIVVDFEDDRAVFGLEEDGVFADV